MSIAYNVRQARGITVVDLSGRITLNEKIAGHSGGVHALIHDLTDQGCRNILLNLRDVNYLDSSGIGELFGCLSTVQGKGGVLKLSSPTERVLDLLRMTKLNTVLDVIEDESQALQSFAKSGAA